ncbi:MAG: hypothetical protein ACJ8LL_13695, partial [Candidatus Udaeobacter sp.]
SGGGTTACALPQKPNPDNSDYNVNTIFGVHVYFTSSSFSRMGWPSQCNVWKREINFREKSFLP